ncbi:hypothetical protein METBIDRAFT_114565 [Metschnikowia bicuspidata var. bicuspidata NRRL YB-4993]|uniref:AMP-activated protein kinase glycogen-binding domain-containing protein n=1 Tax=Metschnikowia bicuspidata var. bicuspidata NRRL YB-4993 TaxID=869754 RepID=A0A1A0HIN8_9ASCO|nr:hypothetical protein METBIDRAFT_114565 [Metschnikowia bicuspidata var. bicuspidata NRRL YB-4993]OBA23875.1 hypothetical protein METBIDRAFT_114565 [Metschnikowia bicuspidata var. bicuspidata NRRL YB-4993]
MLKKSEDSELFEGFVRVNDKQKLVFKFVVDGSLWTTAEKYKVEFDEHGNKNNYIEAEELILDSTCNPGAKDSSSVEINAYEKRRSMEGLVAKAALDFNKTPVENDESKVDEDYGDQLGDDEAGDSSEDEKPYMSTTSAVPSTSEVYSTAPAAFVSLVSSTNCNVSRSPAINRDETSGCDSGIHEHHVIKQFSLDNGCDLENILLTESLFTEVSYVTSNSQSMGNHLSNLMNPEGQMKEGFMSVNTIFEPATDHPGGAGSPFSEQSEDDHNSCVSGNSDYRSDEEVDSIGISIEVEDPGSGVPLPGVFAKIRGLFHF